MLPGLALEGGRAHPHKTQVGQPSPGVSPPLRAQTCWRMATPGFHEADRHQPGPIRTPVLRVPGDSIPAKRVGCPGLAAFGHRVSSHMIRASQAWLPICRWLPRNVQALAAQTVLHTPPGVAHSQPWNGRATQGSGQAAPTPACWQRGLGAGALPCLCPPLRARRSCSVSSLSCKEAHAGWPRRVGASTASVFLPYAVWRPPGRHNLSLLLKQALPLDTSPKMTARPRL